MLCYERWRAGLVVRVRLQLPRRALQQDSLLGVVVHKRRQQRAALKDCRVADDYAPKLTACHSNVKPLC